MTSRKQDISLANNLDESRYEMSIDGELAGFSAYHRRGEGVIVFTHTEVSPEREGQGIGSRLAKYALDDARAQGLRVVARCPFIAAYIERHTEYGDLVAAL
jgi:predicted GNAT family acetyltransferase